MDQDRAARRAARLEAAKRKREAQVRRLRVILAAAGAAVILLLMLGIGRSRQAAARKTAGSAGSAGAVTSGEMTAGGSAAGTDGADGPNGAAGTDGQDGTAGADGQNGAAATAATQNIPALQKETQPEIDFNPRAAEETEPTVLMDYSEIAADGEVLEDRSLYDPWYHMDFQTGSHYAEQVDGILTFRGNSFRDDPTYGFADMTAHRFQHLWTKSTGTLDYNGRTWSGNGWTGQPLMMRWPADVKAHMNMYEEAKRDDDLVEVIYASMDGYIYFLNLKSGERTRDPMYVGWTFKGAGALDPRGYPLLYVGAGYNSDEGVSRAFIISLIDCTVLYSFGNEDWFSLRGSLSFFDSSPLVDASSDTLIWPGENGILYLIQLGSRFDAEAGTVSVSPGHISKWHYMGKRTGDEKYWLGMEDSAAVYGKYLFVCDNGGHMMCLNLDTLRFVWVQDILDDSNGSPVLAVENGRLYLYVSTSFHLGWRSDDTAAIPIWKIDAEDGSVVWHRDYECFTEDGVSGGVQSTPAVGKYGLSDYLYVTVSMTTNATGGKCVCLRRDTGEVVWEHEAAYAWSSPVCVYDADGSGSVLYCASDGKMYLLDGVSGEVRDTYDFGEQTLEASPAVYEKYLVVGTRDCEIRGLELQ